MGNRILLIDGMALLFRHFYATSIHKQFMRNSKGVPTNGVQGFIRHVYTAIEEIEPTHVAVCWDMGMKTFRNDMFEQYKSNRVAPPEEMIPQFDYAKEIAEMLGLYNIGVINYEADDLLGTFSKKFSENKDETYIISGDRDLLQCLHPHVHVWLTKKGFNIYNKYDIARFREEYQLEPQQLIDIKAFMGDTADGYPGVKGIGEKTAIKLIQAYGNVEQVIKNIDNLKPAQKNKIEQYMEDLKISKQLAEIHTNVPLDTEDYLPRMAYTHNLSKAVEICNQHELYVASKYLVNRI